MTHNSLQHKVVRRRAGFLLAVVFYFAAGVLAQAVNLVEEFYLPLPEWQVLQACKAITPSTTDTNFSSITSILVTGDGTVIYYDQWEDGYETNLNIPTQTTTLIWGDGINTNGICPGYTNDPAGLTSGALITLSNTVASSPRNPAQVYYDGRDRVAANKALVITRAGWPSPTGPVFGGSVVAQATLDWGTNFLSPIGQDMAENLFKYTGFFVLAAQNGTVVTIDPDGAGTLLPTLVTLNQGESYFYSGNVRRGGTVNASKPVEVDLVCGDTVNTLAIDWFTLYPQSSWSDTYYNSVGSMVNPGSGTLYPTFLYFYNNSSNPVTMFYTNVQGSGNFPVPVNGGYKYQMPTNSGAVFTSAGGVPYTVLATVASSPSNNPTSGQDTTYNWGFTPLPKGSLTTEADAGYAPGSADLSVNGSPVWVTPGANTRIYVDYKGDRAGALTDPAGGKYDTNFDLVALQSRTIYVPGTNDQSGMRVYTLDGTLLSVAWGEDPSVAGAFNPYLDMGNPVLPFPVPRLLKSAVILTDVTPAGLSINDTLLYSVQVDNKGLLPLGNTVVLDAPPPSLIYVTNSTTLNGFPINDSPSGSKFPLDVPGYTIPIILSGGTSLFQYQATVVSTGSVINAASIGGSSIFVTNIFPANPAAPALFVSKTILSPASGTAGVGQVMQFNLQIINVGNIPLANVSLADNYPSNKFSYVTASVTPTSAGNGQILWTNLGSFAVGQVANLTVSLLVTNTSASSTNFATAASVGNTTNTGSVSFALNAAPTAGVTVNKTLVSPANGLAGIGQALQFNVQVVNSGYTTLTNLSLTDSFPRTNFNFAGASATPDIVGTNSLVWTNLGSFAPGQITNLTVNFVVTNYSAAVTNFATAASVGGATNTGSASLQLSRSGLIITKTVLSPTNQPVSLGSNVVFRILIINSGQNTIVSLPLEDTFSASYFQFVSATLPPSSTGAGSLFWTNLNTPFFAGAVITNDVTMKVTGGATPAYNTAAVNFAVDTNGAAVAPASGTAGVNTSAGSIAGKVYSDPDQSGTLTGGDAPLQNVTLTLYSDPNGDGNPADGSFLQNVASDAGGYYELLNLSTGAYVVVQTVLPGYTGTAPANNRQAVLLAALTASTNNNFFQYQTPPANYATINGTVWNDIFGSGFYQAGDSGLTNVQVDLIPDLNSNRVVDAGELAVQSTFTATNGAYIFTGVSPGRYVIRETDFPGYISTGDTQGTNDNQIAVLLGSGAVTNGNDFFDFYVGLPNTNNPPAAVPDFTSTPQNAPVTVLPLLNDNSPGGYPLTITNVAATNGTASIIGGTNVLFTPTANFTGTATVGYTITNFNGKSSALITITVFASADLGVGKIGPASVFASSNLTYTISVTNFGPSSAGGVVVTDALPAGVTFVSASGGGATNAGVVNWNLGTLANGQVSNVTVTVTAPASGSLTNTANVNSPTSDPVPTNNVTPPVLTSVTPVADLQVGKIGPASVFATSNLTYTISVTNFGPSSASSVVVTDALPVGVIFVSASGGGTTNSGAVNWNLGTLANGQVSNVTVTVTAPASGSLTNTANVNSPTGDPTPTNNITPPVVTGVTPLADVSVSKAGPAGIIFGTNYNYTITVSNAGPSTATSLSVTDSLPVGLAFVSSVPVTTTNASNQVIWSLGNLVAGTSSNLTLTVISTLRGSLTNVASGGSPTGDPVPTNNVTPPVVTSVTNFPPLANPDFYSIGENSGTNMLSPLTNDLVRTPGGSLTIIAVNPTNGTATISGTNVLFAPATNFLGTATIGYTIIDNVGGTNFGLITITVTNLPPLANPDAYTVLENSTNTFSPLTNDVVRTPGGTLAIVSVSPTNGTATISGTNIIFTPTNNFIGTATIGYTITDGIGGTNSSVITVTVLAVADVSVSKTGPANVFAATNFDYTITVTNLGPGPAASLSVTDSLPSAVSFVSASGGGTTNGSQVIWTNLGSLAAGAATNLTVTVTAPVSGGSLTNLASGGSPTSDPTPTNNLSPPVVTTVTPIANLAIGKIGPAAVFANSNLTYTISVTNFGPSSAGSVVVTDALPAGVTFVSASGGGTTNAGVVNWNLGALASGQVSNVTVTVTAPASGSLTNTANVNSPTGDPTPTNNITPPVISSVTPVADLQLGKIGPASVFAASNLTYTISVTNFGPSSASSVVITDSLPAGVTFVSASGGGTTNSGVVNWNLGTLANGQVSNVTVTVTAPASGSLTNSANVNSPTGDPTPTNNVTPPVITTVTPVADLQIGKIGPAAVFASSNLTYTISVTNFGPSSASSVVVTDALPAGVTFVGASGNGITNAGMVNWNLGALASGQVSNVTVTVTAPASGSLTNTANVNSPTGDPTPTNNTTPPVITAITPVADLGIGKIGPATVFASSNLTYTISVTNFGPSSASSVVITDSLPAGVTFVSASGGGTTNGGVVNWNLGTLANGQVSNVTVTVTAPASGSLTNFANVNSPTGDPTPTNNLSPPVVTTVTPIANLALGKIGPATVFANSNLTYTISVTNFGPSSASSVVVTDTLPAGIIFVSASGNGTTNAGVVNWNLGTLTSGQVSNVTVTVTAPASGSLTNTANVNSPTGDPTPTNNVTPPVLTTVTPVADLGLGKIGPAAVFANSNLTYTISVTNFGPSSASGVVVTDTLPAGVTFVSASGGGTTNAGVVNWNLGTLANGQVSNVTVTVTAPASGSLTNTANVNSPTGDPTPTNNVTPPVITVVTPLADLGIGKIGPAAVFASSNLTYTISVTNFGPSSASSVVITDSLPAGVTFVSASGGGTTNAGVVNWNLGTLANGQVSNVTVTVTAPASGSLTNTANVNSPTSDPTPTNNVTPPVITTVTPVADLQIGKIGPAAVFASSNLTYTISVTNFGPSSAGSVVVTDALPAGVTFVSASGNGTTNAGVVNWNLGTLANGQVSNVTVTVAAPASGSLTNTANLNSPTGDPTPTNNVTPPVVTTVTPLADVSVVKVGPAGIIFGTNYNYTITVSNAGPSTATSLSVTDSLPVGLAFVSSVPVTTTNASNQVIWNLGNFGAGTSSNLTVTVISTLRGSLTNTASGGSPTGDPVPTNNVTPPVVTVVTNYPPLANPDGYAMTENTTNTLSPLTNDLVRTPGGSLTIIAVNPTNGTANISGTNIIFTPTLNFIGIATIGYTITDNVGGTNSSLITITVTNIPPLANPDFYSMAENTTNTFSPLTNDVVRTTGGSLSLVSVIGTNGTATISGTNVIFVPTLNFIGVATVGYTITDNVGGTNSSTITITVTNLPPLANPDFYSMAENTTNTFSPLTNDVVRTPGGSLTLISVSPTNGTASISGTNVIFTPTLSFVGIATIGYTIIDNVGGTNSSLITVTVTNQSPLAFAQSVTTTENTALPITLTGSDPAGRPLTFIIVNAPTNGTLTLLNTNTGTVTYTPNNNYTGADAFVFRVNNGINNSSNATIAITVTPVADLLVAQSGPLSGGAGANLTYTVAVTNLGPAGATNVIITNQVAAGFTFFSASAGGVNSGGTVIWTLPVLPANGKTNLTVTVFAVEGGTFTNIASGISDTLDLNATNNNGTLPSAQVRTVVSALADVAVFKTGTTIVQAGGTVNYSITATNNGPSTATNVVVQDVLPAGATLQAASGNYVVSNNVIVWDAATLAGGAVANFTVSVTAPTSGALTNSAFSTSTTPDGNTNNNNGTSSNSIVRTTVTPVADLAIGKSGPAAGVLNSNFSYTISVTNFGPSLATTFSVTDSLPAGLVFVSASPVTTTNASNQVIWANLANLAAGATSNLTLTVKAVSRVTITNFASVGSPVLDNSPTNNVSAPVITAVTNRPPVALDDVTNTVKNVAVTIAVLKNDSDPDGDVLAIVGVSPTNGTANISGTNIVFTPAANFTGTGFVLYTITDGFGGTNFALVTITVTNRPPVANGQSVTTLFNTAKAITLTGSDADSDALTFIIVGAPTNGGLSLLDTNTGAVTYTPNNNYVGADAFTFRVNDGTTNSAVATVSISVTTPVVADLAVFKTGPANGVAGSNLVYAITITNSGPAAATNVLVKDQLPAGFTFVSATPTNVTVANNLVGWGAFNLAAHGKTNFTVTAFSAEGGTFTNIASATSDAFDTNTVNNNGTSTNSQARTIVTARADVAVFKDGGTNVIAGGLVNYTITATNLGPSTATNVVVKDNVPAGATFSSATAGYVISNNVVTWPAIVLTNGASASYFIALLAPASGSFTNIALGTSDTPDPNPTNNNGSVPKARVTTQVVPYADVIVLVFGPTNAVKGSNFVYNIVVTNAGPSGASNVVTSDSLPTNLVFVSASSGGLNTNGVVTWPKVAFLAFGGVTNYSLVVNAPVVGVFTNVASSVATTFDPNPTNNTGVLPASQVLTTVSLAQLDWIAGLPLFNPQTGLYEESVTVTNTGSNTVAGLRLYVIGLPGGVSLWNATGTNGGLPYIQYNFPLNPSNSVGFVLEFYDPTRMAFSNTLSVVAIIPSNTTNGLGTNGAVAITKIFTDVRTNGTRFVIEFNSVPGKTYTILYSADMSLPVWKVGTPSVTANANITQWYDDGPPKTESKPTSVNSRFYRLIQN